MSEYLFTDESSDEVPRLAALEDMFDAATFRHLETIGVTAGWSCLEIGAGGGSIVRWLANRVGPEGSVLATDLDTSLLDGIALANVEVAVHDVSTDPIEREFDLIHARNLLEHLPNRIAVLAKLSAALRPGGWLMVEDPDFSAPWYMPADRRFARPKPLRSTFQRVMRSFQAVSERAGYDGEFGRELPGHLADAGLVDVDAEATSHLISGGSARAAL